MGAPMMYCGAGMWAGMRLMRTEVSPSLTSISATPELSRSSISFLMVRISMK